MAIGVNWKEVWKPVWKAVWNSVPPVAIPDVTGLSQAAATTALEAEGFVVSVVSANSNLQPIGFVYAYAPVGTASPGSTITIYVSLGEATVVGGKPKKPRKRRYQLEVDGEVIEVNSIQEAQTILDGIREKAEETASVAVSKSTKAKKKEVRDVIRDARKTLQVPEIIASPDLRDYASQMIGQIRAQYESALKSIEIGVLLSRRDAEIEQDDEEILMLL